MKRLDEVGNAVNLICVILVTLYRLSTRNYAIGDELSRSMASRWCTLTSSKAAIWNTNQIWFPPQSSLVKDDGFLQMAHNNIFNHFAKPSSSIITRMYGEKVGRVSCFVSRCLQTLSKHSVK